MLRGCGTGFSLRGLVLAGTNPHRLKPVPLARLKQLRALVRSSVPAEIPARADCGVEAVGSRRAEVGKANVILVLAEPVHLVLLHAQLEIFRQFEAEADCAIKRDSRHRRGVLELRHVIAKGKHRREKQKEMSREGFAEWLDFE